MYDFGISSLATILEGRYPDHPHMAGLCFHFPLHSAAFLLQWTLLILKFQRGPDSTRLWEWLHQAKRAHSYNVDGSRWVWHVGIREVTVWAQTYISPVWSPLIIAGSSENALLDTGCPISHTMITMVSVGGWELYCVIVFYTYIYI